MRVSHAADGDYHMDVALDQPFRHLLLPGNFKRKHGWLVIEIVPADEPGCRNGEPPTPATGSYDDGICTGAGIAPPPVGQHVSVTGPYVLDTTHGWAEIHPVWAITPSA